MERKTSNVGNVEGQGERESLQCVAFAPSAAFAPKAAWVRRISSLPIPAHEQVAVPAGDQLTSFSRMADQVSSTATIATPSRPTVLA